MRVELVNRPGTFVMLDKDEYDRLTDAGMKAHFTLISTRPGGYYVRCPLRTPKRGHAYLAREVTKAGPGQRVSVRNGDPLDLRRRNLTVKQGSRSTQLADLAAGRLPPADMMPDGTMTLPDASSGYSFASA